MGVVIINSKALNSFGMHFYFRKFSIDRCGDANIKNWRVEDAILYLCKEWWSCRFLLSRFGQFLDYFSSIFIIFWLINVHCKKIFFPYKNYQILILFSCCRQKLVHEVSGDVFRCSQCVMCYTVPMLSDNIFCFRCISGMPNYLFRLYSLSLTTSFLFFLLQGVDTLCCPALSYCCFGCLGKEDGVYAMRSIDRVCGFPLSPIVSVMFCTLTTRHGRLVRAWNLLYVCLDMSSAEASSTVRKIGLSWRTYDPGTKKVSRECVGHSQTFISIDNFEYRCLLWIMRRQFVFEDAFVSIASNSDLSHWRLVDCGCQMWWAWRLSGQYEAIQQSVWCAVSVRVVRVSKGLQT